MALSFPAAMISAPTTFAITSFFQSSARYHCSRAVRKRFDALAKQQRRMTWMLGRYPGKARLRTEIEGIAVATRIEIGRAAFRDSSMEGLLQSAFELLRRSVEQQITSGALDRLFVRFTKAAQRPGVRRVIRAAYENVFGESSCSFLAHERDLLEVGHCTVFQTLTQFMRQDGLYHSDHRATIETLRRHLQQEVGRYENYRFIVKPRAVSGSVPYLTFYYTGAEANRRIEIFMQEHTKVRPVFVESAEFQARREEFIDLEDYERGSRRFGGLWILQDDVVRHLQPAQVSLLYLFFNHKLQPDFEARLNWGELFERQSTSSNIARTARHSEVFLEMNLEELIQREIIIEEGGRFLLHPDFSNFKQVAFYTPGELSNNPQRDTKR